jgi:manganese transport protein
LFRLPQTATAPFCPSEVRGSVLVSDRTPLWVRILRTAGPGLLVSVGYMDPGNWATDIEAGSKHGFELLWVVVASSVAAMLLQTLSLRLGLVSRLDLARACRARYSMAVNRFLWITAEIAIVATDVAEVLGSALALHLLLRVSILAGIAITAFDTVLVLGLQGKGFRQVEAIVLGLIVTIGACFAIELTMVRLDWREIAAGLVIRPEVWRDPGQLFLAVGILGATVMPHNLYLHSSIVQTRHFASDERSRQEAIRLSTLDTVVSLTLALLINAAILALAAAAFHSTGHRAVADIQDAYHLLDPLVGGAFASVIFGIALLASGQSSTFTGTIAGQILMEGFLELKMPCWKRRVITRGLALVPAFGGVLMLGEGGIGKLLVFSQVALSFQLPFAVWPLISLTSDPGVMGRHANGVLVKAVSWALFALITAANVWLVGRLVMPSA